MKRDFWILFAAAVAVAVWFAWRRKAGTAPVAPIGATPQTIAPTRDPAVAKVPQLTYGPAVSPVTVEPVRTDWTPEELDRQHREELDAARREDPASYSVTPTGLALA